MWFDIKQATSAPRSNEMPTHRVGKFRAAFLPIEGDSYAWTLFFREHRERALEDTADEGTVLFVTNVHPKHSEDDVKTIFAAHGRAKRVVFGSLSSSAMTRYAHVFFEDPETVQAILRGDKELLAPAIPRESVKTWLQEFRAGYAAASELEEETNEFMRRFEDAEAQVEGDEEARRAADAGDGWTLVSYKGRRGRIEKADEFLSRTASKRKRPKELSNFYRFQVREHKRERLAALRARFEEDKQRIAELKVQRKYKPF